MSRAELRYGFTWLACTLVVATQLCGCSKRGAKRIPRSKDAAAVVVVEQNASGVTFADEKEPNDTAEAAEQLTPPCGVRGTLDGETDVDRFSVKVTTPGLLSVHVGGIEQVDLVVDLVDAAGKTLARSDRGPALTSEGMPNYPVAAGDYQIVVSEFVKKKRRRSKKKKEADQPAGRQGPSPPYELVVELADKPGEGQEVEPNEVAEEARELLIGDEGFGYIGWNDDKDVWAVSLEGFSPQYALELDLSPVAGVWLTMEILDGEGNLILERKGDKGQALRVHNLVPVEGAERYFVRISARRSNPDERYSLRPTRRLLDLDEEVEPNDAPSSAVVLSQDAKEIEGTRRGFLTPGDTDCYSLPARSEPMLFTVSVTPPPSVDAKLEVDTDKGQALGESDSSKRGGSESLAAIPVPANTPVVVKVTGSGDAESSSYELRWSLAPGASPAPDPTFDEYEDQP